MIYFGILFSERADDYYRLSGSPDKSILHPTLCVSYR